MSLSILFTYILIISPFHPYLKRREAHQDLIAAHQFKKQLALSVPASWNT